MAKKTQPPSSKKSQAPPQSEANAQKIRQLEEELALLRSVNESLAAAKAALEKQLREYPEHLEQKVRERTRELEAMNEIAKTVSRSLELDVILKDSLAKVLEVLEIDAGAVFLADDKKTQLQLMVQSGLSEDVVEEISEMRVAEEFPGVVALKGDPVLINDFKKGEYSAGPMARYPGLGALVGVPLESKGRARGVFCLLSGEKDRFSEEDLKLLVAIGSEVGVAIENAGLYEKSYAHSQKMEKLSMTDSLTGLFNRRHFYRRLKEEMKRAIRQKFPVSLLVVDLDNLKDYNDRLGHLKGDEALRGVAQAISASIRQDVDTGYRYGGDEFAVILPYSQGKEAVEVAERIRKTFNEFRLQGTGLSIGLSQLNPEETIDDFVSRADTAMYSAKSSGGDRVHTDGI